MPAPKAIVCHLCNGKYFSRSWPIHLKACEAKWKKTHSRCQYCGTAVNNADWSDHRSHCKPDRKKKLSKEVMDAPLAVPKSVDSQQIPAANINSVIECEECEAEDAMWRCQQCEQSLCAMCDASLHRKGARSRHIRDPLSAKALRAENLSGGTVDEKQSEHDAPAAEPKVDGRTECKFCGRKFNPQRVEKHMRICSKATKKLNKRKVYDGAKKRLEGTEFLQYQYNRSSTPEQVKKWKKEGRRWREESSQLRSGAGVDTLDLEEQKKFVEKRMKFRIKGYTKNGEAKDEETAPDIEVIHPYKDDKRTMEPVDFSKQKVTEKRTFKQKTSTSSAKSSARSRESAPSSGRRISGNARVSARESARKSGGTQSVGKRKGSNVRKSAMPLTGSSVKMRQRPTSNTSSNSVSSKGSNRSGRFSGRTRKPVAPKTVDPKGLNVMGKETTSTRPQRQRKKPGVPRFGRNRSTADLKDDTKQSKAESRKPTFGARKRNVKSTVPPKQGKLRTSEPPKTKDELSSNPVRPRVERVQKENDRRAQQPKYQRAKSEANSLPRGIDLGVNVKKPQGDGPKSMEDYLERERLRREQRKGKTGGGAAKGMSRNVGGAVRKRGASESSAVTKKMSRLQLEQKKLEHQKYVESLQKVTKPAGSNDLSSKRAAYFESMMQKQDE